MKKDGSSPPNVCEGLDTQQSTDNPLFTAANVNVTSSAGEHITSFHKKRHNIIKDGILNRIRNQFPSLRASRGERVSIAKVTMEFSPNTAINA